MEVVMSQLDPELLKIIAKAIRNKQKAKGIVQRYYRDKISIIWRTSDVHRAANEREVALTEPEAMAVLETLHHQHNPQLGLRWEDVTNHIEAHVLGRKLTKAEIRRFVQRDILTVAK